MIAAVVVAVGIMYPPTRLTPKSKESNFRPIAESRNILAFRAPLSQEIKNQTSKGVGPFNYTFRPCPKPS